MCNTWSGMKKNSMFWSKMQVIDSHFDYEMSNSFSNQALTRVKNLLFRPKHRAREQQPEILLKSNIRPKMSKQKLNFNQLPMDAMIGIPKGVCLLLFRKYTSNIINSLQLHHHKNMPFIVHNHR